jgi:SSS family solute:Na+ symporter
MEAVADRYGYWACLSFSLALLYRLFSEIWSNTIVLGTFYGVQYDALWWTAVWLGTFIPISYVIMGGQKSSLLSDLGHGTLVIIFLIIVLALVVPKFPLPLFDQRVTQYTLVGGLDQFFVAILQGGLSYPFMDPAMTDRAFLGNPKGMVIGFFLGGLAAMTFIFCFGFIGVYGKMLHIIATTMPTDPLAPLGTQLAATIGM